MCRERPQFKALGALHIFIFLILHELYRKNRGTWPVGAKSDEEIDGAQLAMTEDCFTYYAELALYMPKQERT